MVAAQGVTPSDGVESDVLAADVTAGPIQVEGLLSVVQHLVVPALQLEHPADVVVGVRLAGEIVELAIRIQGVPKLDVGLVVSTEPDVGAAQASVRARLSW